MYTTENIKIYVKLYQNNDILSHQIYDFLPNKIYQDDINDFIVLRCYNKKFGWFNYNMRIIKSKYLNIMRYNKIKQLL